MEGTIDISTSGTTHCVPCTEGLTCPDGSSVEKLKSGSTEDEKTPEIVSGYFSWAEDPTEVFKCPGTHCPGRRPGTCEGGRLGPTCDECGAGMYWADDECRICEVSMVAAWIAGPILVLLAMVVAYYVTDDKYTARASLGECASIGTDMMVAFVQQLGILSAVSVPWPATLKNLFEFSSVFVLNLQSLGFSCASSHGVQQYVLSALFFHRSCHNFALPRISHAVLLLHEASGIELGLLQDRLCHWKVPSVRLHHNVQHWFGPIHVFLSLAQWTFRISFSVFG